MRLKGKLIQWDDEKAFGFISLNGGGGDVFIHKTAFSNRMRSPKINDIITFTLTKDKQGRNCADEATFSGERLKKKQAQKISKFSLYLSVAFLITIIIAYFTAHIPLKLLLLYFVSSIFTFIVYAMDKSKAKNGQWRIAESTLHLISLVGGWPGAAFAQQLLRHKSQKSSFRFGYWVTVIINSGLLIWLVTANSNSVLALIQ